MKILDRAHTGTTECHLEKQFLQSIEGLKNMPTQEKGINERNLRWLANQPFEATKDNHPSSQDKDKTQQIFLHTFLLVWSNISIAYRNCPYLTPFPWMKLLWTTAQTLNGNYSDVLVSLQVNATCLTAALKHVRTHTSLPRTLRHRTLGFH